MDNLLSIQKNLKEAELRIHNDRLGYVTTNTCLLERTSLASFHGSY